MKNIVLSAAAVFAMSSFAIAGGDIMPPEEPMVDVPEVMEVEVVEDNGFYIGLGYGSLSGEETFGWNPGLGEITIEEDSRDFDQLLLQAGYKYNQYVAFEGRYWFGMNDLSGAYYHEGFIYDTDNQLDAWGLYVKPMYPVTPEFDVYALLGYASGSLEEDVFIPVGTVSTTTDLDGFSWGLGVSYTFNDSIIIFADYVSLYNDTVDYDYLNSWSDFEVDTVNIGVSYQF
ncbi:MAG: outer membrane beta-barrel protein [Campylobacterota bacterium]|nr:outer membrane beta-barrel protein [Campylobacterota bacterium]